MKEIKRFNFNDVAAELGYVAVGGPGGPGGRPAGGPGGPGGKPAGGPPKFPTDPESIRKNSLRFKTMWPDDVPYGFRITSTITLLRASPSNSRGIPSAGQ